ncbi:MAG: DUF692 domain-containing protein [Crocinitomicaceae bacterium]|nr:DUF692 domain-containing protein [Crocinitomicaceae bacterium]
MSNNKVGLGLRREIALEICDIEDSRPDFLELAPENWIEVGGYWRSILSRVAEKYSFTAHGLSLSIGSTDPFNFEFLKKIKDFLDEYNIDIYSEHLSFSTCDNAHLYESLPVPFTGDAVKHISERIRTIQDFMERPLVLENITYYTVLEAELSEAQFFNKIAEESKCKVLLDVNNIFVNSQNHNYDPRKFIEEIALENVNYVHIGGHEATEDGLILDTHGQKIIQPVYELFNEVIRELPDSVPVMLERDVNFEDFNDLKEDMSEIRTILDSSSVNV